ncbi:MAG: hypothetical protein AAFX85_14725 [Pseudomonadota bacterium]
MSEDHSMALPTDSEGWAQAQGEYYRMECELLTAYERLEGTFFRRLREVRDAFNLMQHPEDRRYDRPCVGPKLIERDDILSVAWVAYSRALDTGTTTEPEVHTGQTIEPKRRRRNHPRTYRRSQFRDLVQWEGEERLIMEFEQAAVRSKAPMASKAIRVGHGLSR